MGLVDKLRAKLELHRLEQRYTRRDKRTTTLYANAEYVNGEYVFKPTGASMYSQPATVGAGKGRTGAATARTTETYPSSRTARAF